jgi:hypothetical protein
MRQLYRESLSNASDCLPLSGLVTVKYRQIETDVPLARDFTPAMLPTSNRYQRSVYHVEQVPVPVCPCEVEISPATQSFPSTDDFRTRRSLSGPVATLPGQNHLSEKPASRTMPEKSAFYEQVTDVKWVLFFLHSVFAFVVACCG